MEAETHRGVAAVAVLAWALAGCEAEACLSCEDPKTVGSIEADDLVEVSGVAQSLLHDDLLYSHNDSGDSSRLFALTRQGGSVAVLEVDDVANDDWEDLAAGPCAAGACLYIGDIGDNPRERSRYAIHIVPEPPMVEPGVDPLQADTIEYSYEDGSHDAEVLLVHPATGAITIVTKADSGPARAYELPTQLVPGELQVATHRADVDPPNGSSKFTGGAVHPDGTGVLLRTKSRLFHYPMDADQSVADALRGEPCRLPLADEVQGEAVAWLDGGAEILTVGEGAGAPLSTISCSEP